MGKMTEWLKVRRFLTERRSIKLDTGSNPVLSHPNFCINSDKYPADYCIIFYGSEVISVFNFVVGTCALCV